MTPLKMQAVRWLTTSEGQAAINDAGQGLPIQPSQLLKLREKWGVERATALAEVASVRPETIKKLGHSQSIATSRGLQQSSHFQIAEYKAGQLPDERTVLDLCCGIGGDAIAFSKRRRLIAVDQDPCICVLASHNIAVAGGERAVIVSQTAESLVENCVEHLGKMWLHIDPDRRPQGKRVSDANFSSPPAETIAAWTELFAGSLIKLSPAASLPSAWHSAHCREWISHQGQCRQQLVWFRSKAVNVRGETKATKIDQLGQSHSFSILERPAEHDESIHVAEAPGAFVYDFDPAIRAAGLSSALANSLQVSCLQSPAGFFTKAINSLSESAGRSEAIQNLVSVFEVVWWDRFDRKVLKREIGKRDPSSLEIKVRGAEVTPEELRPKLLAKKKGESQDRSESLTLLISKQHAILARRIS